MGRHAPRGRHDVSRLRDLGRYGMLYTPSWNKAARVKVVSDAFLKRIASDARKDIYLKGEMGNRMVEKYYQRDVIGDLFDADVIGRRTSRT